MFWLNIIGKVRFSGTGRGTTKRGQKEPLRVEEEKVEPARVEEVKPPRVEEQLEPQVGALVDHQLLT